MSDYIITQNDRNILDSARKFLADAVNTLDNESDQMIARLGLRAGNSLSGVVIALPEYIPSADPTQTEDDIDTEDPVGLGAGSNSDTVAELIEAVLSGTNDDDSGGTP